MAWLRPRQVAFEQITEHEEKLLYVIQLSFNNLIEKLRSLVELPALAKVN